MNRCPQCGRDPEQCQDAERPWYPQRTICYATREQAAAERRWQELHKDAPYHDGTEQHWSEKASPLFPYHYADGTRIWVAPEDIQPDDHFLSSD